MGQFDKASSEENSPIPTTKQAYRRPELLQYGTLREITLAVNFSGNPDNPSVVDCGMGPDNKMCKTH